MNITIQWIVVGVLLAVACWYLLRRLLIPEPARAGGGPACSGCHNCPAAAEIAARLAEMDLSADSQDTEKGKE